MEYLHQGITQKIIQAYFKVYNTLGYGFLEKVYHNAMLIELRKMGFDCKSQVPIIVHYQGISVGEYFADILVNECVIIEIKANEVLIENHELQLINYLKATKIEIGLLLNFGKRPGFKRCIFTTDRKRLKPDNFDIDDD